MKNNLKIKTEVVARIPKHSKYENYINEYIKTINFNEELLKVKKVIESKSLEHLILFLEKVFNSINIKKINLRIYLYVYISPENKKITLRVNYFININTFLSGFLFLKDNKRSIFSLEFTIDDFEFKNKNLISKNMDVAFNKNDFSNVYFDSEAPNALSLGNVSPNKLKDFMLSLLSKPIMVIFFFLTKYHMKKMPLEIKKNYLLTNYICKKIFKIYKIKNTRMHYFIATNFCIFQDSIMWENNYSFVKDEVYNCSRLYPISDYSVKTILKAFVETKILNQIVLELDIDDSNYKELIDEVLQLSKMSEY